MRDLSIVEDGALFVKDGRIERLGSRKEIESLINRRNDARRSRDFALADQVRKELLDRGIVIEDTREGTKWHRK